MDRRAVLLCSAEERVSSSPPSVVAALSRASKNALPSPIPASAGWKRGACCGWEDYPALRGMVLLPLS